MKSSARNIKLISYEDIFKVDEAREESMREKVQEIPLAELFPFENHPFKVRNDAAMDDMVESIKKYGVLVPGIARPRLDGGYELIAGHRRKYGCELADKATMPVIIRELDDDAATIIMVDSNLQREALLLSERAFAYKMKLEAMKRQAGRPSKENVFLLGTQKRSDQILAEQVGKSRNQIQRYIRLTELIPKMLDMTDEKKIAFNTAVELSYLQKSEQSELHNIIVQYGVTLSLSQARQLKKLSQGGKLTTEAMGSIISAKKNSFEKIIFSGEQLKKYFPDEYTSKQIEEVIIRLLEIWHKQSS